MEMQSSHEECRNCGPAAKLTKKSVDKLVAEYVQNTDKPLADDATVAARLEACGGCGDLLGGFMCRHCSCFVQVRARLAQQDCPRPGGSLWSLLRGTS